MSAPEARTLLAEAPAPLLVVGAAVSVQLGAALATTAFDVAGPLAFVWLRVGLGALFLLALNLHALRRLGRPPELRWMLATGATIAVMNASFYGAIDRIPLGAAVAIEFLGPLAVAVLGSRRPRDFLWIALAGGGVALLASPTLDLDGVGILLALAAAVFWAGYILAAKRMLAVWPLPSGLTSAMLVAALLLAPLGVRAAGDDLADARLLATGVAVAVFASVVPFTLELAALQRLPVSTFGILMSLEPAVAAIVGAAALAQIPGALEALAIVCVVVASVGANRDARQTTLTAA